MLTLVILPTKSAKALSWADNSNLRFKKIAWIRSHHLHLQWKFKLLAGKFTWGNKAKYWWVMSKNFLLSKVCWQYPAMFCDWIETRQPFKIFSTLLLWAGKFTHMLIWFSSCLKMKSFITVRLPGKNAKNNLLKFFSQESNLAPFVNNGTKAKISSEIEPPLGEYVSQIFLFSFFFCNLHCCNPSLQTYYHLGN